MSKPSATESARIRQRLKHPIVDGDGHIVEIGPVMLDYIKQVAGPRIAKRYTTLMTTGGGPWGWYAMSDKDRRDWRAIRPPFWIMPARNTTDRATAMLPQLMRERMDEFGIDYSIVYTSTGLPFVSYWEDELRRAVCRSLNVMYADLYRSHAARLTPAAVIPMHTPKEAIEETEYAVKTLGLKAVMIAATVQRPIKALTKKLGKLSRYASWIDPLALDSDYDYDPVWRKFVELGVSPSAHSNSMGWGARATTNNYMYNHIGHFAASGEAFAKALFFGGVTKRFPQLNIAFLEGGVAWACNLFGDIVEHWEKRNARKMLKDLDPRRVDAAELSRLLQAYGKEITPRLGGNRGDISYGGSGAVDLKTMDEFAAAAVTDERDLCDRFIPNFYYGCEADDRMVAVAFNSKLNHFGVKLKAVFSSDAGHWDVTNINAVLAEAYGLVEDGLISEGDFRSFTFANIVEQHGQMNPNFFKGTAVEGAAAKQLRRASSAKSKKAA
ncbi:MAG: amidohydrolase [Alphaproteobacteria bacterium]|nr:amidohydrolase [Alphaproteobacteria bacterium]